MLRKLALWMLLGFCWNAAAAQTVTTLHTFDINNSDGIFPLAALMQASDGNLYGTTTIYGNTSTGLPSAGAVFQIQSYGSRQFATLYHFAGKDGGTPAGQLVEGPDGNLYGTAQYGGSACTASGCGTVFRFSLDGTFTTLYNFQGGSDGSHPEAGLVLGSDGNFYGVTSDGGDTNGDGTIFRISSTGAYAQLYALNGPTDGALPITALLQASDGNFYGAAKGGGANGLGTVFQITPAGKFTVLHTFSGSDGAQPSSGLVETASGTLVGVTEIGGGITNCDILGTGCGAIFSVTPTGSFSLLHSFENEQDGEVPAGNLFLASDGRLYGTSFSGGTFCNNTSGCSAIFSLNPDGSNFTILAALTGNLELDGDAGGLLQANDGNFYGTSASVGNAHDWDGAVYELSMNEGLPGPIEMAFEQSQVPVNTPAHLSWKVLNGFSTTMQQCFASVQGSPAGAGTWTGLQTGTISGGAYSGNVTITPTEEGTYVYILTCGGIEMGSAPLAVGISPLAIATISLPNGTVGVPYSATLTATGGVSPYTWNTSSGNLPDGLALNPATGAISGTPTASGTENFAVTVKDSEETPETASAALSITIAPAPIPTLTANPTSLTITDSGVSNVSMLTTTNFNLLDGAMRFSCSGLPAGATCLFNPLTAPTPPDTQYTTLQIAMDQAESVSLPVPRTPSRFSSLYALALPWLLLPAAKRGKKRLRYFAAAAFLLGSLAVNGCSNLTVRGSSQNTYPVTVTATVGTQIASTTIQLNVTRW